MNGNPLFRHPLSDYNPLLQSMQQAEDPGIWGAIRNYEAGQEFEEAKRREQELLAYGRPLSAFERMTQALPDPNTVEGAQDVLSGVMGGTWGGGAATAALNAAASNVGGTVASGLGKFFDPQVPSGFAPATVWHGSPHKYDVMEWSPRTYGTGEGSQAFGHGLYFADAPETATTYRAASQGFLGQIPGRLADDALAQARAAGADTVDDAITDARDILWRQYQEASATHDRAIIQPIQDAYNNVAEFARGGVGHLYEVELPDEAITRMLDLDAMLSEQPGLASLLDELGISSEVRETASGKDFLKRLESAFGKPGAAQWLNERNVPGTRFYDAHSRARMPGNPNTRNYAVWDADLLSILSRNGQPLP